MNNISLFASKNNKNYLEQCFKEASVFFPLGSNLDVERTKSSKKVFFIEKWVGSLLKITDAEFATKKMPKDLVKEYLKAMGNSLAKIFDKEIFNGLKKFEKITKITIGFIPLEKNRIARINIKMLSTVMTTRICSDVLFRCIIIGTKSKKEKIKDIFRTITKRS
jgi:hypothetical protein